MASGKVLEWQGSREDWSWGAGSGPPAMPEARRWAAGAGPEKGASWAHAGLGVQSTTVASVLAEGGGRKGSEEGCGQVQDRPVAHKGKRSRAGPPDRGEGEAVSRAAQESLRASGAAPQSRRYSHSRSSGLDLAKKVSSTLALRAAAFSCAVPALPTPGRGHREPFSAQTQSGHPTLPPAHNNSLSRPACFCSSNSSGAPKVGILVAEAEAGAGDEEEKHELDPRHSDQMACRPFHTDLQALLLQTHPWTAGRIQLSPDRATLLIRLTPCTRAHPQPQARLPRQNISTELGPRHRTPTREARLRCQHLVPHLGNLKKQTGAQMYNLRGFLGLFSSSEKENFQN